MDDKFWRRMCAQAYIAEIPKGAQLIVRPTIRYSKEDGGYIATCPAFPGLSAYGDTSAQAHDEFGDALRAWIGAAQAAGKWPFPALSETTGG